MAGQLDTALKKAAKQLISQLGNSLDSSIIYTRKSSINFNQATGEVVTENTEYSIKVPIEFIDSTEEGGFQENAARLYITPDLIGDNQPLLQDEITITFSGSLRQAKITNIQTLKGAQEYLFRVDIVF